MRLRRIFVLKFEEVDMLGLSAPAVWSVYLLCIFSALFCIIYGAVNWNKGDETIYPEDKKWVEDEKKAEEAL